MISQFYCLLTGVGTENNLAGKDKSCLLKKYYSVYVYAEGTTLKTQI